MLSEKVTSSLMEFKEVVFNKEILDPKVQSLVALAISAAISCKPCIQNHYQAAKDNNATEEEISAAIGTAIFGVAGKCKNYTEVAIEELKHQ